MAGVLGNDTSPTLDSHLGIVIRRSTSFPHNPTDRRRAEGKAGSAKNLRQSLVSHRREQAPQLANEIPDEIRVPVDRFDGLNQGALARFIEPTHPDHERLKVDQEHLGRLLQIPAASRPELENPHPLDRGVVGSSPGLGPLPAAILNTELLLKEGNLGLRLFELDLEPAAAGGATPSEGYDDAGEGDRVQNPGLDVTRPLPGQADRRTSCHCGLQLNFGGARS
jgi:hypothetical protein